MVAYGRKSPNHVRAARQERGGPFRLRRSDLGAWEDDIIPVARISYGFGAGKGRKPGESANGEGEGGGGGLYAAPLGVLEVSDAGTRFVGLNETRKFASAALAGFCLGAFWARCRR